LILSRAVALNELNQGGRRRHLMGVDREHSIPDEATPPDFLLSFRFSKPHDTRWSAKEMYNVEFFF